MNPALVDTGKRVLPARPKEAVRRGLRAWGRATAIFRSLPDFLVIGTKRGGTTSLWNYLIEHPVVLPMWPSAENLKSPHYFYWHYDRGERWYRSHFATGATKAMVHRREGRPGITGEASPYYMYDPRVAERVGAQVPHAKIIMLLRDPVERAYSHYKERVRAGVERLDFEAALAAEETRLAGDLERMQADPLYYSRPHDYYSYRDRGIYHPQVARWRELFPAESLLIVPSERMYADPQATYDTVTDFLELPRHRLLKAERWNYRPAPGMPRETRDELRQFYRPHNSKLYEMLGEDFGWD